MNAFDHKRYVVEEHSNVYLVKPLSHNKTEDVELSRKGPENPESVGEKLNRSVSDAIMVKDALVDSNNEEMVSNGNMDEEKQREGQDMLNEKVQSWIKSSRNRQVESRRIYPWLGSNGSVEETLVNSMISRIIGIVMTSPGSPEVTHCFISQN